MQFKRKYETLDISNSSCGKATWIQNEILIDVICIERKRALVWLGFHATFSIRKNCNIKDISISKHIFYKQLIWFDFMRRIFSKTMKNSLDWKQIEEISFQYWKSFHINLSFRIQIRISTELWMCWNLCVRWNSLVLSTMVLEHFNSYTRNNHTTM